MPRADDTRLPTPINDRTFILACCIFIVCALYIPCNSIPSTISLGHLTMPRTKSPAESPSAKKSKATPVPLSQEEINVLRSHLDEWNRNKGKARRRIRDAAIAEARVMAPKMDRKMLKLRRKVSFCN